MSLYAGMRIIVDDGAFKTEHHADELRYIPFHPLVRWVCRRLGWREGALVRGKPIYRTVDEVVYVVGDTAVMSRRMYEELQKATNADRPAPPPAAAPAHDHLHSAALFPSPSWLRWSVGQTIPRFSPQESILRPMRGTGS